MSTIHAADDAADKSAIDAADGAADKSALKFTVNAAI